MDPSPFHDRDLDREAEEWIVSSALEAPENVTFRLVIHLEKSSDVTGEAEMVKKAVRAFFSRTAELADRELRRLLRIGRKSLAIGLSVVAAAMVAGDLTAKMITSHGLAEIIRESLLIGGWVAMWRPIEIFLYDWWPIRQRRRVHERLRDMNVVIRYCGARCEHDLAPAPGRTV
jgi:hypothetical protein